MPSSPTTLKNEAPSLSLPRSAATADGLDALLQDMAARWRSGSIAGIPATLPEWLLRKLRARLERGTSGGDGVADALPPDDSPAAQVAPVLDAMQFDTMVTLQDRGLLDRAALAAVHAIFSEARAELASRTGPDAALRQALAARDHQLSVATHELRTPISSILLNLQILERTAQKQGTLDTETVMRLLAVPSRQVRRLTRMVDLLLDSAQVETGRLVLDLQPVDLCEVVHDTADRLAELARAVGCELNLSDCHPVQGQWDRLRLEQVMNNLLTNAIKYGGGMVQVHTLRTGEACVVVRDNGRGIAPEDQERIFQPYERVHGGGAEEGAGLGLYIVREIVRAHGGRIEVESRLGHGAAFRVCLPLIPPGATQGGNNA